MTVWLKKILIDLLLRQLLTREHIERLYAIVQMLLLSEASGAEKRALAAEELKKIGAGLASHLINLAVELAVARVRA